MLPPEGNGFIAVFVCAIVLGIRRPDIRVCFETRSQDIIELVKLGIFVVFGSLLTLDGLFSDGVAAARSRPSRCCWRGPMRCPVALAGSSRRRRRAAFMAWFGPKGVATMTFSLFVLGAGLPAGEEIFNLAALTVFVSIVVHGLTDTPGAKWLGAREEAREAGPPEPAPATTG